MKDRNETSEESYYGPAENDVQKEYYVLGNNITDDVKSVDQNEENKTTKEEGHGNVDTEKTDDDFHVYEGNEQLDDVIEEEIESSTDEKILVQESEEEIKDFVVGEEEQIIEGKQNIYFSFN